MENVKNKRAGCSCSEIQGGYRANTEWGQVGDSTNLYWWPRRGGIRKETKKEQPEGFEENYEREVSGKPWKSVSNGKSARSPRCGRALG